MVTMETQKQSKSWSGIRHWNAELPRRSADKLLFLAHQHKTAGMEIKLSKNNDHDGVSHGVECSQEDYRILPLKSSG